MVVSERGGQTVTDDYFDEGEFLLEDAFASAYLRRLRAAARTWVTDVQPSQTSVETMNDPIAVSIRVPGVSGPVTTLWVLCRPRSDRAPWLHGSWGDRAYVGDDYGVDPDRDLTVEGLELGPEALADLAAQWLEAQLLMEIHRDEWAGTRWGRRDILGPTPYPSVRARWGAPRRSVLERRDGFAAPRERSWSV